MPEEDRGEPGVSKERGFISNKRESVSCYKVSFFFQIKASFSEKISPEFLSIIRIH
ncbi:hypothetical protein LEP1GSC121_2186 [Leptospira borgpetersenii serovar Castellonis str. 200801910]|uniref:Uncharacterized protein n=1 Tax=Leptospira borgpetersenii serovar Ballum TaxID=280505 RepID=A0A0S2IUJ8_LEPBO|nr:hypothetical protein LBBP_03109 [Leptospira borgpetersenii serovar Ballum]EKQ99571.1 hypothetical protein LEP1GSC121_2186 [Leptospira borgpetersenii serovar Castellonis str. 200801910]